MTYKSPFEMFKSMHPEEAKSMFCQKIVHHPCECRRKLGVPEPKICGHCESFELLPGCDYGGICTVRNITMISSDECIVEKENSIDIQNL
jgi:hypothetical protein